MRAVPATRPGGGWETLGDAGEAPRRSLLDGSTSCTVLDPCSTGFAAPCGEV